MDMNVNAASELKDDGNEGKLNCIFGGDASSTVPEHLLDPI